MICLFNTQCKKKQASKLVKIYIYLQVDDSGKKKLVSIENYDLPDYSKEIITYTEHNFISSITREKKVGNTNYSWTTIYFKDGYSKENQTHTIYDSNNLVSTKLYIYINDLYNWDTSITNYKYNSNKQLVYEETFENNQLHTDSSINLYYYTNNQLSLIKRQKKLFFKMVEYIDSIYRNNDTTITYSLAGNDFFVKKTIDYFKNNKKKNSLHYEFTSLLVDSFSGNYILNKQSKLNLLYEKKYYYDSSDSIIKTEIYNSKYVDRNNLEHLAKKETYTFKYIYK